MQAAKAVSGMVKARTCCVTSCRKPAQHWACPHCCCCSRTWSDCFWVMEADGDDQKHVAITLAKATMGYESWENLLVADLPDTTVTHRVRAEGARSVAAASQAQHTAHSRAARGVLLAVQASSSVRLCGAAQLRWGSL